MYWVFTTMATVGYGDISAVTKYERLFCTIAMLVSAGVYATIINVISKKVSEFNALATKFREYVLCQLMDDLPRNA